MVLFKRSIDRNSAIVITMIIALSSYQTNVVARPNIQLLETARGLLARKETEAAINCLNRLISDDPNNALAYCERGRALALTNNLKKALEDNNRAISLNPKLAIAYVYRAAVFTAEGQYHKALEDSDRAIALSPKLASAYFVKTGIYDELKDYQKAIETCNQAIEIDPKSCTYILSRAAIFRKQGRFPRAIQDCNLALSLKSKNTDAFIERGYIYLCLANYQKAVADCTIAINISPHSSRAYLVRSEAYRALGLFEREINDLTIACGIDSKVSAYYLKRGFANYRLWRLKRAIQDFATAINLDPFSPQGYEVSACAHEELEKYGEAISLRTKVLSFKPNDALALSYRAKDYEFVKRSKLAQADWSKVKEFASPSELARVQLDNGLLNFGRLSQFNSEKRANNNVNLRDKNYRIYLSFHTSRHGQISVPVRVNGKNINLMLDSGCDYSELWKSAMPGIGKLENMQLQKNMANGKKSKVGFFIAQNLTLGDHSFPSVPMTVADDLIGLREFSGLLGGNILQNFVVVIDYEKQQIVLHSSTRRASLRKEIILPMRIRDNKPYCLVKLNKKMEVMALIDTGSPSNISAYSLLRPVLKGSLRYTDHLLGPWLGNLRCTTVILDSLSLGEFTFERQSINVFPSEEAPDASETLTLGNTFLSQFKSVTLDYLGRQIIFELK